MSVRGMRGRSMSGKPQQNHPQATAAKVTIRRNVLDAVWGADRKPDNTPRVFDAFAGTGEMFAAVWSPCVYVGCDTKYTPDSRTMFCADNRRVMRAIDLAPFNVFDFDAFGSPWHQALILADRRKVQPGERIGVVLTNGDGYALTVRANMPLPYAMRELTGLRGTVAGLNRQDDYIDGLLMKGLARRMRCNVLKTWRAVRKSGAKVRYIGMVLEGLSDGAVPAAVAGKAAA